MSDITRHPLCWPNNVPRTPSGQRGWPLFNDSTISGAVGAVLAEINRLNKRVWSYSDDSVIVSTNLRLRKDLMPVGEQAMPEDPGAAVYFNLRFWRNGKKYTRHCVLTCDRWRNVTCNLIAIAKDIEAQRARERWGSTTTEQAFQGYLAIPEKCGGPAWWTVLGVDQNAPKPAIEDAYKKLAKKVHPDMQTGSHELYVQAQTAYEQALARFRS